MDQPRFTTHLSASNGDPLARQATRVVVNHAIRIIRSRHEVQDAAAFAILVQTSAEDRCTVRETASRMVQADHGAIDRTP